jgi:hypothetical protein
MLPFLIGAGIVTGIAGQVAGYLGQKKELRQQSDLAELDAIAARENATANAKLLRQDAENKREVARLNSSLLINDSNQLDAFAMSDYEALISDANALERQGNWQINTQKLTDKRMIGDQFSAYGKAGVSFSGSALEVLNESKAIAEENLSNLYTAVNANIEHARNQAEITLTKGQSEAQRYRRQAELVTKMGEIEAQRIETEADITEKMGMRKSQKFGREAESYGAQSKFARVESGFKIGQSLLRGAEKVYKY